MRSSECIAEKGALRASTCCVRRVVFLRKLDAQNADDMQEHQVLVNSCGAPESMADRPVQLLRMGPNEVSALQQNVIQRYVASWSRHRQHRTCVAVRWCSFLLVKHCPAKQGALIADSIMCFLSTGLVDRVCVDNDVQQRIQDKSRPLCMHEVRFKGII